MIVLILKNDGTIYDALDGDYITIMHYENETGRVYKTEYKSENKKITRRIAESFTREEINNVK